MTCTVAVMIEFSKNKVYWQRRLMLLVGVLLNVIDPDIY